MRDFTNKYRLFDSIVDLNMFGTRKLAKYLSYLMIPKPKAKETIKTMLGFSINVEPIDDSAGVEHELYYKGTYEKATMHVIKTILNQGDTCVDVGANIGVVSLYSSLCVGPSGKVLAFEANPATVTLLMENIELNKFTNIEIFEFALGAEDGKGEIYPETVKHNRGAASMVKRDGQGTLKYDIVIKKLDDVIGDIKPKVIKIDVEGWEVEVLKGCRRLLSGSDAPILIVECFINRENTIGSPSDIFNFVKSTNDYKIYKSDMGKDRLSKLEEVKSVEELPEMDNITCIPVNKLASIPKGLIKN
jgi:FkbM family methyltransferase